MKYTKVEIEQARAKLLENLKPGDTVYTEVTHVARSGMSRSIRVLLIQDNEPWDITWLVARVLGESLDPRNGGLKVGGCGMDMAFATVYNLGRTLWPEGHACSGESCRSNDHANYRGPGHSPRGAGVHHQDAGYALHNRSL